MGYLMRFAEFPALKELTGSTAMTFVNTPKLTYFFE
jgi:hypothetical protein